MAATPYHVVHSFVAGKHDRAGAFVTTGDAIYSYNMKLAHKDSKGRVVYDYKPLKHGNKAQSVTTARHMRALESVCDPGTKAGTKKNPAKCVYSVQVNNIGTVYLGENKKKALKTYADYVSLSKSGRGRAAHDDVFLLCDGELVKEYLNWSSTESDEYEHNPKKTSAKVERFLDRENVEVFHLSANEAKWNRDELRDLDRKKGKPAGWHQDNAEHNGLLKAGWYYWQCFPGCLPEGSAMGPFKTEYAAAEDAFENWGSEEDFED